MELLDIWRQARLQSALRSNVRNKWIWEHVADQLWHRGFVRSGEQCKNKVHNLLCVYRNVCRGRLPRWRCRYFELLHRSSTNNAQISFFFRTSVEHHDQKTF